MKFNLDTYLLNICCICFVDQIGKISKGFVIHKQVKFNADKIERRFGVVVNWLYRISDCFFYDDAKKYLCNSFRFLKKKRKRTKSCLRNISGPGLANF